MCDAFLQLALRGTPSRYLTGLRVAAAVVEACSTGLDDSDGVRLKPLQWPGDVAVRPGGGAVGRRYAKACEIATGGPEEGQLEERVENVVELIDRAGAVRLPALDSETRTDPHAVADAYDHAYDALLATAFD